MAAETIRLGVDIGGTFTDVVLEKGGESFSTKVLTTYAAPENAIIDGMHQVCTKAGVTPADLTQIIHGTTLATNALIERRGIGGEHFGREALAVFFKHHVGEGAADVYAQSDG